MSGIHLKRHDIDIVCMLRHEPYVADMIFCVADTVNNMSLCCVDLAPQKKRHDTDISSQAHRPMDLIVVEL
jgi:hypothetical protein